MSNFAKSSAINNKASLYNNSSINCCHATEQHPRPSLHAAIGLLDDMTLLFYPSYCYFPRLKFP